MHEGKAARYDLRYALTAVTDETWDSATPAELTVSPAHAGNFERAIVEGLDLEQEYFFGLRTIDESENSSALSNLAAATTVRVLDLARVQGAFAIDPDWSPDGRSIIFGQLGSEDGDIYLVPATGGDVLRLGFGFDHEIAPQWSADGRMIGVISNRAGKDEIWAYDLANPTAAPVLLASHETNILSWAWAPNGAIAYAARTSSNPATTGIFTVASPGAAPLQLVDHPSVNTSPAWSPDGSRIAFSSTRSVTGDIWVMSANGGDQRAVTDDSGNDGHATWSPDGQRIAFLSDRSGTFELWTVSLDGGAIEKVPAGPPGSLSA